MVVDTGIEAGICYCGTEAQLEAMRLITFDPLPVCDDVRHPLLPSPLQARGRGPKVCPGMVRRGVQGLSCGGLASMSVYPVSPPIPRNPNEGDGGPA